MRKKFCWLRLRRHVWTRDIARGDHLWKQCDECGTVRRTHHVSCPRECKTGLVP